MRGLLLPPFAGMRGKGVIEGLAINILRVIGQIVLDRQRQVGVGSIGHSSSPYTAIPPSGLFGDAAANFMGRKHLVAKFNKGVLKVTQPKKAAAQQKAGETDRGEGRLILRRIG
jgi:threonine synthase